MPGGGKGAGVRREEWGPGSPQVPYFSVILHGLLQDAAGQLRLRPVPQPAVQGLQVGLHAGAPGEVLQRGDRNEETQTQPGSSGATCWHPWLTGTGTGQHQHPLWQHMPEGSAVLARFRCLAPRGWGPQRVPPMVARPLCACSGSEPWPHLREAKSPSDHKSAQSRLAAAL